MMSHLCTNWYVGIQHDNWHLIKVFLQWIIDSAMCLRLAWWNSHAGTASNHFPSQLPLIHRSLQVTCDWYFLLFGTHVATWFRSDLDAIRTQCLGCSTSRQALIIEQSAPGHQCGCCRSSKASWDSSARSSELPDRCSTACQAAWDAPTLPLPSDAPSPSGLSNPHGCIPPAIMQTRTNTTLSQRPQASLSHLHVSQRDCHGLSLFFLEKLFDWGLIEIHSHQCGRLHMACLHPLNAQLSTSSNSEKLFIFLHEGQQQFSIALLDAIDVHLYVSRLQGVQVQLLQHEEYLPHRQMNSSSLCSRCLWGHRWCWKKCAVAYPVSSGSRRLLQTWWFFSEATRFESLPWNQPSQLSDAHCHCQWSAPSDHTDWAADFRGAS